MCTGEQEVGKSGSPVRPFSLASWPLFTLTGRRQGSVRAGHSRYIVYTPGDVDVLQGSHDDIHLHRFLQDSRRSSGHPGGIRGTLR